MSSAGTSSTDDERIKTVQFTSSSFRMSDGAGLSRPRLERQVGRMDLSTGILGARAQYITLIDHNETPRNRWDFCKFRGGRKPSNSGRVLGDGEEQKQYRIRSMVKDESRIFFSTNRISENYVSHLNVFLRWTFRASFWEVGVLFLAFFMVLILFFAILTYLYGRVRPACIWTNAGDYKADGNSFVDAYQLSWTTLSTVGYGLIGPRVSTIEPTMRCFGVNFFMAVESFIGVLFGSITGAIIFGKIARFQSIAQVRFSDPICVRYGSGVLKQIQDDEDDDPDCCTEEKSEKIELPCPILEFRLINDLSNVNGGEVVDANISVVACTLEDKDELESLRMTTRPGGPSSPSKQSNILNKAAATTSKVATKAAITTTIAASRVAKSTTKGAAIAAKTTGVALFEAGKRATQATGTLVQRLNYHLSRDSHMFPLDGVEEAEPYNEKELERALEKELEEVFAESLAAKLEEERRKSAGVSMLEATRTSVTVDEGSKLVPRRIFHRLEIETDTHPFFKRVWNIRHVLNESSPLLSPEARRMIAENNGFWPEELNDHEKVREHLKFDEIIANFSGTANASGSSVYAQKLYDYADVNVGYTFANVLTTSYKGQLLVDPYLLNDVLEQNGGGAEPFTNVDESRSPADIAAQIAADAAGLAVTATQKAAEGVQAVAVVTGDTVKTHAINAGETIVAQAINTTETLQAATKGVFRTHARSIITAARAARKFGDAQAADSGKSNENEVDVESGVVSEDSTSKDQKTD